MKLQPISFDVATPVRAEFALETTGKNRFWYTLIARFSGRYADGSSGRVDASYILGMTQTAVSMWKPAAVVLDLSRLT